MVKPVAIWALGGVALVGIAATAASAWVLTQPALDASSIGGASPPANGGATSSEPPGIDVPALYTGDELQWLLLSPEELDRIFGAMDIAGPEARATLPLDGDLGMGTDPAVCAPLTWTWPIDVVGERRMTWTDAAGTSWVMRARQIASPEIAQEAYGYLGLTAECAAFSYGPLDDEMVAPTDDYSFQVRAEAEAPHAHVIIGRVDTSAARDDAKDRWAATVIQGNAVVTVDGYGRELPEIDPQALADALVARASGAYANLVAHMG